MKNLTENKSNERNYQEEMMTALNGMKKQAVRTGADTVVLGAELGHLTLKGTATVVEGGILLSRAGIAILPEDIDEFMGDVRAFIDDTKDTAKKGKKKAKKGMKKVKKAAKKISVK